MADSDAAPSGAEKAATIKAGVDEKPKHVTAATTAPAVANDADVPDPDEDDLDDLDDMLDDFSNVKVEDKKPATSSGPGRPASDPASTGAEATTSALKTGDGLGATLEDDFSEEDFQKQLQAGMAELMGDFEKNVRG
jgi:peroxin-19